MSAGPPTPAPAAFEGRPLVIPVHVLVAGRTRLKIGSLYRSPAMKRLLEEQLAERSEVEIVSIGLLTGSILLRHDPATSARDIARLVENIVAGGVPQESAAPDPPPVKRSTRRRAVRKSVLKGETQEPTDWHRRDVPEVLSRLVSGYGGLLPTTAAAKLRQYGPNLLPEAVPRSGFTILLDQVKSLPMLLLFVSAGVSVATGGVADAAVILAVVAINAVIGYTTESRAEMIIHSLKRLVHPSATLLRGARTIHVPAEEVVPGDVVVLRPGVLIPADCRVIDAQALTVDESALTGESLPVRKTIAPLELSSIPLAERTNMAYMGTLVTGGQGLAVVVATARYTELGNIQELVGATEQPKTPMERELDRIGNRLVTISVALCGGLFVVGLLRGMGFLQMVKTSIALGVAAIPEGLPTVATTVLALGIHRMKRRHALIRRLNAVETLGAVGTICLDKTGTLTMNRMSVRAVVAGEVFYDVIDGTLLHEGEKVAAIAIPEILHLLQVAALCNEAVNGHTSGSALNGSATESALLSLALAAGMDIDKLRRHFPLLRTMHRAEGRNYMITTHTFGADETGSQRHFLALKGNPSEVLALCSLVITRDGIVPLDEEKRLAAELANERMAGQALRVLGAAYAVTESPVEEPAFIWTGLLGLADPIRPGMKELIAAFHSAGIATVMITGDQVATAYAVGRELELSGNGKLEIFDAAILEKTDPELLAALARKVHIFARVNPAQKLRIVQALQRGGQIVAMTGDGVNDTPALKAADIGIAMGSTGTDAAREVADVVLEDDNLRTLIGAIEQGRTIYGNIRKSVRFLLSTNFSEIFVMTAAVTLGLGQPLNPMQLLWINLVSDIFPGLALSLEAPEPDVLSRPPRSPDTPILGDADMKEMMRESAVLSVGSLAAFGYGIARYGRGPQAASLAFMSLTGGQILHTLSCRSEKPVVFGGKSLPPNRYLTAAVGGTLLLQGGALLVPPLRSFLGLTGMTLLDLLVAGGGAVLPLVVNEGAKEERNSR